METAFIITDKNKMPYAVVSILKGGTEFHPLSENAKTWSGWMNDEYAVRQVSKGQLTATLDNSMSIEGPIAYARNNKLRLDELIAKAKKIPVVEQIEGKKSVDELHVISILDAQLHQLDDSEWHNAIQFKAGAFVADSNKASMNFEVKRTRALWDAGLSIPGTNRRGGWRCPPGMAFGGQITDRFGRNCGAGLARRLANGLQNVGERIENADDAKRGKRVARRNAAMGRRLAGAGAIERGAGRLADALETAPAGRIVGKPVRKVRGAGVVERGAGRLANALESKPPKVRGAGRIERGAGRLADALESKPPKRTRIGRIERGAGRLADALESRPPKVKPKRTIVGEADKTPIRDNAIRRGLRDIAPDLMAYAEGAEAGIRGRRNPVYEGTPEKLPSGGVRKPKAPKAAAAKTRPAKPRKPRVAPVTPKEPKEPKLVDDVSGIPVPKGLPKDGESLSDYMTRKYNEHQEQIRLIQKGGGKAGFLKRPEWDKFHGPDVEANWKKKNAGRAARATASDAKAPKKPVAPKKPAAPKKPFTSPRKGFADRAEAQRTRARMEAANNRAEVYKIVQHDGKFFVVENNEVNRANAAGANLDVMVEPPRAPARPAVVKAPTPTPVLTAPTAPKKPRVRKADVVRPEIPVNPKPANSPIPNGEKKAIDKILRPNPSVINAEIGKIVSTRAKDGSLPTPHNPTGTMTKDEAIKHVKNGGDMALVPREHMLAAIEGNLRTPQNPNGKFISKIPNGGAIGDTRIYVIPDKNGQPTKDGWVFKGASEMDNIGELMGFNFAAAHGFDIDGAQADGRSVGKHNREMDFMVIPMDLNHVPDGWKPVGKSHGTAERTGTNFHVRDLQQLPDAAAPQRVAHFLHNYLLGTSDRHFGNGMAVVLEKPDGTKVAHIVPIDQGWVGAVGATDFVDYGVNSGYFGQAIGMDTDMFSNIKTHLDSITNKTERDKQAKAIVDAVDGMIERSQKLSQMSPQEVQKFIKGFYPNATDADIQNKISGAVRAYAIKAAHLKANKAELLKLMGIK